jgi:hypothetical protein
MTAAHGEGETTLALDGTTGLITDEVGAGAREGANVLAHTDLVVH